MQKITQQSHPYFRPKFRSAVLWSLKNTEWLWRQSVGHPRLNHLSIGQDLV